MACDYVHNTPDALLAPAKHHGIDPDAVRKAVTAKQKASSKEASKPTEAADA